MQTTSFLRPELLTMSAAQLEALKPYFVLFFGTLVTIILSVMRMIAPKWPVFIASIATLVLGLVVSCAQLESLIQNPVILFNGMMSVDGYSTFFNFIFMGSALLTVLVSFRYLDHEKLQHPEYYLLILLSTLGMMLMTSAHDLIVLFIALEIMSLAVYVLVGFRRADRRSNEAAMKYFILGSAASAILLYGMALVYGATGLLNIRGILAAIQSQPEMMSPIFTLGLLLVVLGFLFKVASVPFHSWMPDVYEGAPTPVTGFMTTGLKAAAFAAFLRVFVGLGYGKVLSQSVGTHLHDIIWVCAVLTMIIGNVVALTQTNLKRMLAYSSIAHTGYLLVGILAGPSSDQGYAPLLSYLVAYAIMNLGAFAVLGIIGARDDHGLNLHDMSGLSKRHPLLAFSMAIFLFSMAGIPPTAGFAAKYLLFYSAVQADEILLVVISVLCSAISVYYYLRVLVYMYMRDPLGSASARGIPVWAAAVVGMMVFMTLQFGIVPSPLVQLAKQVITSL